MIHKYYDNGLSLIAIIPKTKEAKDKKWEQFCTRMPSEEEIDELEAQLKYGLAGIGAAMGCVQSSGWAACALDLDTNDPIILSICPISPVMLMGQSGRRKYFFKTKEVIRVKHKAGVDFLGVGSYCILPPSIHPDTGKPYYWATPDTLENTRVEDLPELDFSFWDKIPDEDSTFGVSAKKGRNNTLKPIVCAMLMKRYDLGTIINEIYNESMRLFPDSPLFYDKAEGYPASDKKQAMKNAGKFVVSMAQSLLTNDVLNLEAEEFVFIKENAVAINKATKFPEPRGLLKDIYNLVLDHTPERCPEFAFGTAIAAMATICSNRYQVKGIGANMYILLVGPSGVGKTSNIKPVKKLLTTVLPHSVGYNSYTSVRAMVNGLEINPARIDIMDEFANFMMQFRNSNNTSSAELQQAIADIWSSSTDTYKTKAYAPKEKETEEDNKGKGVTLHNPCVSILSAIQNSLFSKYATEEAIHGGFLPRFFFCVTQGSEIQPYRPIDTDASDFINIANQITKIVNRKRTFTVKEKTKRVIPHDLWQHTKPFEDLELKIKRDAEKIYSQEGNEILAPFYKRRFENIAKLAMIDCIATSVDKDPRDPSNGIYITEGNLQWAEQVFDFGLESMTPQLNLIGANPLAKETGKILGFIASKEQGASGREIQRKFHKDERTVQSELVYLEQVGMIKKDTSNAVTRYKIA